jgi:multiple sugar transport system substrate-binding protein
MSLQNLSTRRLSRRQLLKAGATTAATLALAACAPTAAPAPAAEGEKKEEAKPAAKEVELRLTFWGDLADMPTWKWGIGEFAKVHPEIKVKWENTPWGEYWTKLQTEVAGGTTPDVVGMVSMYSQQYIRQGTLLSLNPFIEREPDVKVDDFWPAIMGAYTWKNETFAFPYDLSTMLLMYNKKMFDEASVPYPATEWTWEQFLDACTKMTKAGQWGFLLPGFDWTIDAWLSTNKARFISEDGLKCLLDSAEAIETVQFLADLRNKSHVSPTPGEAGDIPLFETGKAGITWGNPEFVQVLTTRVGPPRQNDKFAWDVALVPKKQQNGNGLAGGSFAIGKSAKYTEEAWTFIKFYTSGPILREMVGVPSRGIPGRKSVGDSLVTDQNPEHQKYFLDVLDYPADIMHVLAIPAYQQAVDTMSKYLDQIFLGQMTAAEGLPKVVAELNPILEKTAGGA